MQLNDRSQASYALDLGFRAPATIEQTNETQIPEDLGLASGIFTILILTAFTFAPLCFSEQSKHLILNYPYESDLVTVQAMLTSVTSQVSLAMQRDHDA